MTINALIGYTGFVGSTLLKQTSFGDLYRSTNIHRIDNKSFNTVICAGAPAQKWLANKEPESDLMIIKNLIAHLKTIKCDTFVLISTVDVFKSPVDVDESTPIEEQGLHAYGFNRRLLEKFVESHFENYLIVRLPGLVGPNLRKNIIFDFLNSNNLDLIESRSAYQFYPMVNMWPDIQTALEHNLKIVHLTASPIGVTDIAKHAFGLEFDNALSRPPVSYDMKTRHAGIFGAKGDYQYGRRETLLAIRSYAQSEPQTLKVTS